MAASLGSAATEILRPLYPCYRAEPSRLTSGCDGARVTRDGFMLSKDLAWKSASSADTENLVDAGSQLSYQKLSERSNPRLPSFSCLSRAEKTASVWASDLGTGGSSLGRRDFRIPDRRSMQCALPKRL